MASMPNNPQASEIVYTPEFKRNLRQLAKKYRRIKSDLQPVIDQLTQGRTPGDQIPGIQYEVFKARARNSDAGKGKSGGYRIIYHRPSSGPVVLITVYSKSEQSDITSAEIRRIISESETQDHIVGDPVPKPDDLEEA
jgi:mRNA-degrading endonuclease RelE of RelBE toxin-antitoxin system